MLTSFWNLCWPWSFIVTMIEHGQMASGQLVHFYFYIDLKYPVSKTFILDFSLSFLLNGWGHQGHTLPWASPAFSTSLQVCRDLSFYYLLILHAVSCFFNQDREDHFQQYFWYVHLIFWSVCPKLKTAVRLHSEQHSHQEDLIGWSACWAPIWWQIWVCLCIMCKMITRAS